MTANTIEKQDRYMMRLYSYALSVAVFSLLTITNVYAEGNEPAYKSISRVDITSMKQGWT